MKHSRLTIFLAAAALAATAASANATGNIRGMAVDTVSIERAGDFLSVTMGLDIDKLKVSGNRAKVIVPVLANGSDSIVFEPVGLYGRRRYYYYRRNDSRHMIAGEAEKSYLRKNAPARLVYTEHLPYQDWMKGARLTVSCSEYGCCRSLLDRAVDSLGMYDPFEFRPEWVYARPTERGPKTFEISGSAFIDFPVDKVIIYPEYRNNPAELAKIQQTIDAVRGDADVTIDRVWLKGFASPESPYRHNTELSLGRVAALKKHIQQLYNFDGDIIETANEPEDWAGLRRFVEASNLEHRDQILAIIDSDLAPDPREARIKKLYPEEYRVMLTQYYPALRHTDYRINYTVRAYDSLDDIRRIYHTTPSKLSAEELFELAQSYEPGSPEFKDVMDTAAHMFPDNTTANLNAAMTALQAGDTDGAREYLSRSGESPLAQYARGVMAAMTGKYGAARQYFIEAQAGGIPEATDAIIQLQKIDK